MEKHRRPFIEISVEAIEEVIPDVANIAGIREASLVYALMELWNIALVSGRLDVTRDEFAALFGHFPPSLGSWLAAREFIAFTADGVRILVGGHVRIVGAK